MLNYIEDNNLSDQDILDKVELYNENKLNNVANRINTFKEFMENLENGYIMEQTNKYTRIKSSYLIVQTKDNLFLHLGIKNENYTDLITDYEIDDKTRDILETYFQRKDNKYFKNSKICEEIESIKRYDEKEKKFKNFSFDKEKNKNIDDDGNMPNNDEISSFRIKDNDDFVK